jgi:hypothetical protein
VPGQTQQLRFQIGQPNGIQWGGQRNDRHDKSPDEVDRCSTSRMTVGSDNSGPRVPRNADGDWKLLSGEPAGDGSDHRTVAYAADGDGLVQCLQGSSR